MKKLIFIVSLGLIFAGCKKEEIIIYNTQLTPDLSNPVIQKLTNTFWYNPSTIQEWQSIENITTPAETVAEVLYSVAWKGLCLNRDGTSLMLFVPPMYDYNFVYCQGTWTVSEEEENTIIMVTKTPVSNATVKIKVTDMQTKDNMAYVSLSMNFGNRLLSVDLNNALPDILTIVGAYKSGYDYTWFDKVNAETGLLKKEDFTGTWATAAFDSDLYYDNNSLNVVTRSTYVEDILTKSQVILKGVELDLNENGSARIVYSDYFTNLFDYRNKELTTGTKLYSNATWAVSGNKLTVKTDELIFFSVAEGLFGVPVHDPGLIVLRTDTYIPFRLQAKRFYTFEIISRETIGNWCRVTSNDGISYLFLYKRDLPSENILHVSDYKK